MTITTVNVLTGEVTVSGEIAPSFPIPIEQKRLGMSLSFAQLLIGLVAQEWITEAEGEAWLAGTPPQAVVTLISTLPAEQRFAARARATRPSVVLRLDPLVLGLAQAQQKTEAEMDTFFETYAQA